MAVFSDSAPWSFASETICALLEHACSVSEYEELYGNDFRLTYYITTAYQTISPLVAVLSASLYAAQDFKFIRNVSAVGLGVLFVPLVVLGYHMDSFLMVYLAGIAPGLFAVVAGGYRLHHLSRERELEVSVYGREGGSRYSNRGSVNEGLADYRKSLTQQLANARGADYRRREGQRSATELQQNLL
jgi:hypothetical protein